MASTSYTGTSPDYSKALENFDLDAARSLFSGSFSDGINACVECCDAHMQDHAVALDWIALDGHHQTRSFSELRDGASRFANLLTEHGIRPGDIIAGLLPRTPDLVAVVLGALRAGATYQPLFTAFEPQAIQDRLTMSGAKLVVTDAGNRTKLEGVKGCPPLATIVDTPEGRVTGDIDFPPIGDKPPASSRSASASLSMISPRHPRTRDFTTGSMSYGSPNTATRFFRGQCVSVSGRSFARPVTKWAFTSCAACWRGIMSTCSCRSRRSSRCRT